MNCNFIENVKKEQLPLIQKSKWGNHNVIMLVNCRKDTKYWNNENNPFFLPHFPLTPYTHMRARAHTTHTHTKMYKTIYNTCEASNAYRLLSKNQNVCRIVKYKLTNIIIYKYKPTKCNNAAFDMWSKSSTTIATSYD